jgi:hypothetical protein
MLEAVVALLKTIFTHHQAKVEAEVAVDLAVMVELHLVYLVM